MKAIQKVLVGFLVSLAVLVVPQKAQAIVVFDNTENFFTSGSYLLMTQGAPFDFDNDQAAGFTVTGGSYALNSIELPVTFSQGPNEFDLWLVNDNGGQPGSLLESFHFSNPPEGTYYTWLTANSASNPVLNDGNLYWVVGSATGPDAVIGWNVSRTNGYAAHTAEDGNGGHVGSDWNRGAFRVTGSEPGQAPVPEPDTLSLFGAGLAGFLLRRRKK